MIFATISGYYAISIFTLRVKFLINGFLIFGVTAMLPGSSEWLIIFGIAVLIFGPSKLPKLGGAIGEGIKNFKKGVQQNPEDKIEKSSIEKSNLSKQA